LADNVWELHMKFCEELAAALKQYDAASSGLSGKNATAKELLMIKEKEMDEEDGQKSTDEELEKNVDIQLKNSGPQNRADTAFNKVMEVIKGGS